MNNEHLINNEEHVMTPQDRMKKSRRDKTTAEKLDKIVKLSAFYHQWGGLDCIIENSVIKVAAYLIQN